jgi:hypothetical protein
MTGAGSARAAQFIYSVAPKDGTTIGTFGRTIATAPLLTPAAAQFDGTKFTWLDLHHVAHVARQVLE